MTEQIVKAKTKKADSKRLASDAVGSVSMWLFLIFLLGYFIKAPVLAADSVRSALEICAFRLIPSLFPFIVLTGLVGTAGLSDAVSVLFGKAFERIFGINRAASCAFLLGAVGGFPVGAVMARRLFADGKISRDEAGRLITFTNNAGIAFCVGGIGIALYDSSAVGWMIYLCQLTASIIIGIAGNFGKNSCYHTKESAPISPNITAKPRGFFRGAGELLRLFSDSVANGGLTMLKICSFAVFFAVIGDVLVSVITLYFGNLPAVIASAFCELTLSSRLCAALGGRLSIPLCGFAVGFSGMSVHMQVATVLSGSGISMRLYFLSKLIQGILTALFCELCLFSISL